ncbi:hypothetical protein HK096_011300, partial [Nowakowskiella sp. JEL0078]
MPGPVMALERRAMPPRKPTVFVFSSCSFKSELEHTEAQRTYSVDGGLAFHGDSAWLIAAGGAGRFDAERAKWHVTRLCPYLHGSVTHPLDARPAQQFSLGLLPSPFKQPQRALDRRPYENLLKDIQNPLLAQLLVFPNSIPANNPDFVPRVWLRSRLIPEIVDAEEALREDILKNGKIAESVTGRNAKVVNYNDEAQVRVILKAWE